MQVAVFRAEADGVRTAARLATLGHVAALAPVIRIVPTGAALASDGIAGVVFTSAHASAALHGDAALPDLVTLPCWCVGDATAAAARGCGFRQVESGGGDAAQLAELVRARMPIGGCVLLLAGRDRKPTLEHRLSQAGVIVRVIEVYRAENVPGWSQAAVDQLRCCEAALHFSHRSAALAMEKAVAHGLADDVRAWQHHCISRDAAEPLRIFGVPHIHTAALPDEESVLASLSSGAPFRVRLAPPSRRGPRPR